MPIYEYACKRCEHRLDALQKLSDDPLRECPECGEESLKRLVSAPRFRLKGEGWYETDFKKDNQRNLAKGDGDKAAKPASDGKGGEKDTKKPAEKTKPAAKPTSKSTDAS